MSTTRRSSTQSRSRSSDKKKPRPPPKEAPSGPSAKVASSAPVRSTLPRSAAHAIEKAREALYVLHFMQRRSSWAPDFAQRLARDYQEARAMLSKAEATLAAWRRGMQWATLDELVAGYERFAVFVRALHERGGFRERRARAPRRPR